MRVLLDERRCDWNVNSVGEAVTTAAGVVEPNGRMVTDIFVDGQRLDEREIDNLFDQGGRVGEVRLISAQRSELAADVFEIAAETLVEIDQLQQEAAELVQTGQTGDAMSKLGEAIRLWMSVHEATVKGATVSGVDLSNIAIENTQSGELIAGLAGQLAVLRDSLQANDPVAMSDALLYELPETITQWKRMLDILCDMTRNRDAG